MFKKWIIIIYPYLICVIAGIAILIGAYYTKGLTSDLLINMAAAFFVIPAVFVLYESTKKASQRRINKELFEYTKMQVDTGLFEILSQVIKSIYPYEAVGVHDKQISSFLNANTGEIKNH